MLGSLTSYVVYDNKSYVLDVFRNFPELKSYMGKADKKREKWENVWNNDFHQTVITTN